MDLHERTDTDLSHDQLDNLFNSIGWRVRGENKWQEVLRKSSLVYTLWDADALVGMGRIVDDGVMCMFYDIGVRPGYQNQGLGTLIVGYLLSKIRDKGYASVGLFPWEDAQHRHPVPNVAFYEKFGFKNTGGMECLPFMKPE